MMQIYWYKFSQDTIDVGLVETVRMLLGIGVLLLWCSLFGLVKYYEPFNVSN